MELKVERSAGSASQVVFASSARDLHTRSEHILRYLGIRMVKGQKTVEGGKKEQRLQRLGLSKNVYAVDYDCSRYRDEYQSTKYTERFQYSEVPKFIQCQSIPYCGFLVNSNPKHYRHVGGTGGEKLQIKARTQFTL